MDKDVQCGPDRCPETRIDDQRELREIEERKEKQRAESQKRDLFADQTPRERRLFKEDGTPNQVETKSKPQNTPPLACV